MNVYVYSVTRLGQKYELKVPARSRVKADERVKEMKGRKAMQIEYLRMDNGMDQTAPRVKVNTRDYTKVHGNCFAGLKNWWFRIPGVGLWTPGEATSYEEARKRAVVRGHMAGATSIKVVPFHVTTEADLEQMGANHV